MKLLYTGTSNSYDINTAQSIRLNGTNTSLLFAAKPQFLRIVVNVKNAENGVTYTILPVLVVSLAHQLPVGYTLVQQAAKVIKCKTQSLTPFTLQTYIDVVIPVGSESTGGLTIIVLSNKGESDNKTITTSVYDLGNVDVGYWLSEVPLNLTANSLLQTDAIKTAGNTPITSEDVRDGLATEANATANKEAVIDAMPEAPDNVSIGEIKETTDKLDDMIQEDSAGNEFKNKALVNTPTVPIDPEDLAEAMKQITGITEGGTWNWGKVISIMTAWTAGNWRKKAGASNVQELLDAEDGTTVILEQTLTRSPESNQNYRTITVKI